MKRFVFTLLPMFSILLACAQRSPIIKGYAFQRVTLPAIRTTAIAEGSSTETQRAVKEKITSFVFVEHKSGVNIRPAVLWLNGIPYQVTFEPVKDQTVIISRNSVTGRHIDDTLVRRTQNHILSVSPVSKLNVSKPAYISKKITNKNAVLEYFVKGKKYYYVIPSIKKLEPLALQ